MIIGLFILGAILGLFAEFLSRRLGIGGKGSVLRRVTAALFLGGFAAGYFAFLHSSMTVNFTGGEHQLYSLYAVHLFLVTALLIATLTDFDAYIIPDAITIPSTVIALILMTLLPAALPAWREVVTINHSTAMLRSVPGPLCAFSPDGTISSTCFCQLALGGWILWSFALLDRRWLGRFGFRNGLILFLRRIFYSRLTPYMMGIFLCGTVALVLFSHFLPEEISTDSANSAAVRLLSSMIGLLVGMALVWTVRIVGRLALRREAMGFGDVVLMGLIGSVVGWQGAVLVFFLAPFAGLVFGLLRAFFRSGKEIPYGPFLALATVALFFFWKPLWSTFEPIFSESLFVLGFAGGAFVVLVILLFGIGFLRRIFSHPV